ncbi:MAG: DUF4129 domain-containing protein [Actinomycetota bacterium]
MTAVDPDEARDAADDILSGREYAEQPQSLVSRALEWVFGRLEDVLAVIAGGDRGVFIGYAVVAVAIVVALYFLIRVMPRRRVRIDDAPATVTTELVERADRDAWLARAAAAESEGRWDDAVHARYRALTEGLADADRLSPEPSATASEHRRRFADDDAEQPVSVATFDRTTGRYEQVWFGADPADRTDVADASAADDELLGRGR